MVTRIFVAAFVMAGLLAPFAVAAAPAGYVYLVGPPLDFDAPYDVKPATAQSECWNRCWNLTLRAGSNPASFAADHQRFNAFVPQSRSFLLTRGTAYLFEVWDSKGRVERDRFTL